MILIVGLILIMLIIWGIRAGLRRARKKARVRAEAKKARAAALPATPCRAEEPNDGCSPANCQTG